MTDSKLVRDLTTVGVPTCKQDTLATDIARFLIKKLKPRYNVLLRDDKNHPHIKLSVTEAYPRIHVVRRPGADGERHTPVLVAA